MRYDSSGPGEFLLEEEQRREREDDIKGGVLRTVDVKVGTTLRTISEQWVVIETAKDGDCFYNTMASGSIIARQLFDIDPGEEDMTTCMADFISKDSVKRCSRLLRFTFAKFVGDLLEQGKFVQEYVGEETNSTLDEYIGETYRKEAHIYLDELYEDGTWSTELDLSLFAHFAKVCILVFSPGTDAAITGLYGDKTHPPYYVFANGTHFELLLPKEWFLAARIQFDNTPTKALAGEFIPEEENLRYRSHTHSGP